MDAIDSVKPISYTLTAVPGSSDLTPGTQIAVRRLLKELHPALKFLYPLVSSDEYYFHHGVYLGECTVAHFSGNNKDDAKPRRCDILEFIRGSEGSIIYRVDYDNPALVRPTKDTLRRANEAIDNPDSWKEFEIILNNCESFATWLKTGVKKSAQAKAVISKIVELASAVKGRSILAFRVS